MYDVNGKYKIERLVLEWKRLPVEQYRTRNETRPDLHVNGNDLLCHPGECDFSRKPSISRPKVERNWYRTP
jgi:hypothetical protein